MGFRLWILKKHLSRIIERCVRISFIVTVYSLLNAFVSKILQPSGCPNGTYFENTAAFVKLERMVIATIAVIQSI